MKEATSRQHASRLTLIALAVLGSVLIAVGLVPVLSSESGMRVVEPALTSDAYEVDETVEQDQAVGEVQTPTTDVLPESPVSAPESPPPSVAAGNRQTVLEGNLSSRGGLSIERLGFDVPLNTMSPDDDIVNPPNGTDAFIITGEGFGGLGSEGMSTFVVLHSGSYRSGAVGNKLIDRDAATTLVRVGEQIELGNTSYEVVETRIISKNQLEQTEGIWEHQDGRLVIFTCLQRSTGKSVQNVVIIAEAVSAN